MVRVLRWRDENVSLGNGNLEFSGVGACEESSVKTLSVTHLDGNILEDYRQGSASNLFFFFSFGNQIQL